MRLSNALALLVSHTSVIALAIKIGRGLNRPTDAISSVPSQEYRHTGYVDQKVRQNAYNFLNHESWHQRNVASPSSNASLGPSNITSDSIAVDEASILPVSSPLDNSTNSSSSTSEERLTDIPELVQSTTALESGGDTDNSWNSDTDGACVTALKVLHGIASNPSGLAPCYNVRSYNNITGTFKADVRIYQITAPIGRWTHLQSSSESLDVSYDTAQIVKSSGIQKRQNTILSLHHPQRMESRSLYPRRANGDGPRMLQGLTLLGMIQGDFSLAVVNETMLRSVLAPIIAFSGSLQDGTVISTQLSITDASFVNGFFTNPDGADASSKTPASPATGDKGISIPTANTLAVFPVGFVITSVWALLLMMIMGYSMMNKVQARRSYRERVKSRMSGGIGGRRQI